MLEELRRNGGPAGAAGNGSFGDSSIDCSFPLVAGVGLNGVQESNSLHEALNNDRISRMEEEYEAK